MRKAVSPTPSRMMMSHWGRIARFVVMRVRGAAPASWSSCVAHGGTAAVTDCPRDGFSQVNARTRARVPPDARRTAGGYAGWPGSAVDRRGEGANAPQVAVVLGVVQAVADNELVGDVEPDIFDVDLHFGDLGLAQERTDLK